MRLFETPRNLKKYLDEKKEILKMFSEKPISLEILNRVLETLLNKYTIEVPDYPSEEILKLQRKVKEKNNIRY